MLLMTKCNHQTKMKLKNEYLLKFPDLKLEPEHSLE